MHVWSHDTSTPDNTPSDNPEGVYAEIDEKEIYLVPQREVDPGANPDSEQTANLYASLNPWDTQTPRHHILCHGDVIWHDETDGLVNFTLLKNV